LDEIEGRTLGGEDRPGSALDWGEYKAFLEPGAVLQLRREPDRPVQRTKDLTTDTNTGEDSVRAGDESGVDEPVLGNRQAGSDVARPDIFGQRCPDELYRRHL